MHEVVVTVIFLAAVMLLIEALSIVTRLFMNSGEEAAALNPVIIMDDMDDAELKLEYVLRQLRWNNDGYIGTIILVCDQAHGELYEYCRSFCEENEGFELCTENGLKNILCRLQKNGGK
ncbi:MAG: hypothetical protein ACI4I9_06585 [Porcipelethomonas sp.]